MRPNRGPRGRTPGFTMLEVLFTLMIAGILVGVAAPSFTRALARSRVDHAALVVASDLETAFSLAARMGTPVRLTFDAGASVYRLTNRVSGEVLHTRGLGEGSEFPVASASFSPATIDVFPKWVASAPLVVTLGVGDASASVDMSSAGHIRVGRP